VPASSALRRSLAAIAALPLLTLAACGYGSEAKDDGAAKVAAGAKKIDGLDTVKIGYFGNLTHGTALVGFQKGIFQKALGATKVEPAVFNAGPSEIEALNSESIDIGWIGPSPAINGYTKSAGKNLRIIGGSASGGVKLVVNPDKVKSLKDVKGKRIATPQLGNTQDVAFLNWAADQGWKVDPQIGKGASRSSAAITRSPRTPSRPARSTAPGCRSRPRRSWSPRAARCCSTSRRCGRTRSS
jgi:NitT/TauT family transport system substrate-binding protein